MPEVRVDPLTGLRAIIATDPSAALSPDAIAPERDAQPDLFTAVAATGAQESIDHGRGLAELDAAGLAAAMAVWRERMNRHAGAACLHMTADEGPVAQLYALSFVPAAIAREREAFSAHAVRTMGGNLLGDLVQDEVRRRERLVAYDDEAVCLAPYASRVPYQLLVAPRRPTPRFQDDGPLCAALLHDVLGRLARHLDTSPPLNLWVRTAPAGADHFAWRIDVLPRPAQLTGLELGTGVNLNVVAPERAAAELRGA